MSEFQPMVRWNSLVRCMLVAIPLFTVAFLSPSALIAFGVEYINPGGSALAKIHPATYLAFASLVAFCCIGYAKQILHIIFYNRFCLWPYFAALAVLFLYAATTLATPFMYLIDTFLFPGLMLILIVLLDRPGRRYLARMFDIFMVLNSLLGIYEVSTDWRLIPLTQWSAILGQWVYPHEWRSTAFLGHPLSNGWILGAYLLSLFVTKRIPSLAVKLPLIALHMVAMIAFGSRAAFVFLMAGLFIYVGSDVLRALKVRRIPLDTLVYLCFAIPTFCLIVPLVLSTGYADRFIDRFIYDGGSAESRSIALDIFANFSVGDLLKGPAFELTQQILKRYRVIAIENFWLNFLLSFGIIGCLIFFPALAWLVRCMRHYGGKSVYVIMLFFFACCSTAVGLSTKTPLLALMIAICLTNEDVRAAVRRQVPARAGPVPLPAGLPVASLQSVRST